MPTLKEISYNILNLYQGGRGNDDYALSLRQIEFWVKYYREVIIKQQDDKDRTLDSVLLQDLGCVPMVLVDSAECCEITTCDRVLRTKDKIPQPITLSYNEAFTYVGSIDFKNPFQKIATTHIPFVNYDKYIGKLKKWYYKDGYIYIVNDLYMDFIKVVGVFYDPTEIAKYKQCGNGNSCYDDNTQYPISGYMVQLITQLILEKELNIVVKLKEDIENNAKDDSSGKN